MPDNTRPIPADRAAGIMNPRDTLSKIPKHVIEKAVHPLDWWRIEARIETMDFCAPGGVSNDATLIAGLVVLLCEAQDD